MIAALEGEHPRLAAGEIAHQLQRILVGLGPAHVEMATALHAPRALDALGEPCRQLDLLAMQEFARHLWKAIELTPRRLVEARVRIAEVHGGVPHLEVQIRHVTAIVEE